MAETVTTLPASNGRHEAIAPTGGRSLARKLAVIMGSVAGIEKRGWNPHHKYNYVLSTDVYEVTRKLMAEHGVVLLQKLVPGSRERITTEKGGTITKLQWEFVWVDSETGEREVIPWESEGQDAQDKGTNKCATAARKYFLVTQLQIPIDQDDADAGPALPPQGNGRQAPSQAPGVPARAPQGGGNFVQVYMRLAELASRYHNATAPLEQVLKTLSREGVINEDLGPVKKLGDIPLPLAQQALALYERLNGGQQ